MLIYICECWNDDNTWPTWQVVWRIDPVNLGPRHVELFNEHFMTNKVFQYRNIYLIVSSFHDHTKTNEVPQYWRMVKKSTSFLKYECLKILLWNLYHKTDQWINWNNLLWFINWFHFIEKKETPPLELQPQKSGSNVLFSWEQCGLAILVFCFKNDSNIQFKHSKLIKNRHAVEVECVLVKAIV